MSIVSEFIGWVVGDFIPFGDLVSDVLLWISLPQDKPDSYDCSATSYTAARTALAVATIVDSFPEVSVLLAIVAGVVAALVFGPAYLSTGENEQALREICSSLWQCLRHTLEDGKSIVYFIYHDVGEREMSLGTVVKSLVWTALVLPHLPFLWVLRMCGSGSAYYKIIAVQAAAGAVTGLCSVFFALVSGETLAIVSAVFAMYSLVISTLVAVQRGKKAWRQATDEGFVRGPDLADSPPGCACAGSPGRNCFWYILLPACFIGFPVMGFLGLYYMDKGTSWVGQIMTSVGFAVWAYLLCYVNKLAKRSNEARKSDTTVNKEDYYLLNEETILCTSWVVSGAMIMLVCGWYFFITSGKWSAKAVSLVACGSLLVLLSACCTIGGFKTSPFFDSDWPEHLRPDRRTV